MFHLITNVETPEMGTGSGYLHTIGLSPSSNNTLTQQKQISGSEERSKPIGINTLHLNSQGNPKKGLNWIAS